MASVKIPNYNKWNRPPTSVYETNYGYGINFYQPMIDYINEKEHGITSEPPHLPWNNERGLEKYRTDKPIVKYSNEDLNRISKEVSEQAKRDLNTFNIAKRSPFSVCATAAAANVTKHVGVESVTIKSRKKKVDREKIKIERQKKRMDEIEKDLQLYEAEANVGSELRSKAKMYRGKSAKAIAQTLYTESMKNVEQGRFTQHSHHHMESSSKKHVDISIRKHTVNSNNSHAISESIRTIRETSPRVCFVKITSESPTIDDSYLKPLHEIKETLKQLDYVNTSFHMDKR